MSLPRGVELGFVTTYPKNGNPPVHKIGLTALAENFDEAKVYAQNSTASIATPNIRNVMASDYTAQLDEGLQRKIFDHAYFTKTGLSAGMQDAGMKVANLYFGHLLARGDRPGLTEGERLAVLTYKVSKRASKVTFEVKRPEEVDAGRLVEVVSEHVAPIASALNVFGPGLGREAVKDRMADKIDTGQGFGITFDNDSRFGTNGDFDPDSSIFKLRGEGLQSGAYPLFLTAAAIAIAHADTLANANKEVDDGQRPRV